MAAKFHVASRLVFGLPEIHYSGMNWRLILLVLIIAKLVGDHRYWQRA